MKREFQAICIQLIIDPTNNNILYLFYSISFHVALISKQITCPLIRSGLAYQVSRTMSF